MTLLPLALALTLVQGLALPVLAADPLDIRIVRLRGSSVTVRFHETAALRPAQVGMGLEPGDEVRTGAASGVEIALSTQGVVSLREHSLLRVPPAFGKTEATDMVLEIGALLIKIKRAAHPNLRIRTPTAVAAVRGTEFAVESAGVGQASQIGVFDEGRVAASNEAGEVELGPGQETTCAPGAAPQPPRPLAVLRRYRAEMRELRGRLAALQREYRRLPKEKLRELRRGGRPDEKENK